jgi:ABC-type nitrate/sulfonate/bicarbonate transport system substrate-binding protein
LYWWKNIFLDIDNLIVGEKNEMKKWRKIVAGLLIVLLSLTVAACGADGNTSSSASKTAKKPVTIKVGMVAHPIGPVSVGIGSGAYKAAGLNIQPVSFNSGADGVKALVGGSLDIAQFGYEHVLRQRNNGLDVKAYALVNQSATYQLVVKKSAPYKQLNDLKGKTLAVTAAGSLSDSTLKYMLQQEKINPAKDVQIINAGTGAPMTAAIQSGKAAAGMVSEPTLSLMVSGGNYRVLAKPNFQTAGLVVIGKTNWVKAHAAAFKKFLKVTQAQVKKTTADPAYGEKALKKWYPNVSDKVLTQAVKNVFESVPADLKVTKEGTDQVLKTQLSEKTIKKSVDFSEGVDLSYLPK